MQNNIYEHEAYLLTLVKNSFAGHRRTICKLALLLPFGQRGLCFSHGFSLTFYFDAPMNKTIQDCILIG
jgi:hypothetical protein